MYIQISGDIRFYRQFNIVAKIENDYILLIIYKSRRFKINR
jgi:hypothetical protein